MSVNATEPSPWSRWEMTVSNTPEAPKVGLYFSGFNDEVSDPVVVEATLGAIADNLRDLGYVVDLRFYSESSVDY